MIPISLSVLAFACATRGPVTSSFVNAVDSREVVDWVPLMRYGPAPTAVEGVDQIVWEMAIPTQMALDLVGPIAVATCQEHLRSGRAVTCESVVRPCMRLAISRSGMWIWHWVGKCGPADPSSWRYAPHVPDGKGQTTYYTIPAETVPILANDVDGAWVYQ